MARIEYGCIECGAWHKRRGPYRLVTWLGVRWLNRHPKCCSSAQDGGWTAWHEFD